MSRVETLCCMRRLFASVLLAVLIATCDSCAARSVGAYRREHLADPIMSYRAAAKKEVRRIRTFEAREGSTGGAGGEGGGCACK